MLRIKSPLYDSMRLTSVPNLRERSKMNSVSCSLTLLTKAASEKSEPKKAAPQATFPYPNPKTETLTS